MPTYQYGDILEYFREIAISNSALAHQTNGPCAFIASDISDQQIEQMADLKSTFMVYGYNPQGVDSGRGSYTHSMDSKPMRAYAITIGLFKEVSELDSIESTANALIAMDDLADDILEFIFSDQENRIFENSSDKCFLKYLDPTVPISRGHTIGNRRAIGIALTFIFNFCRSTT